MLNGIPSILGGELLAALDAMGHSDIVVIADAHFPAERVGHRAIDLPAVTAPQAVRAICAVLPLDAGPDPVATIALMRTADGARNAVQDELVAAVGLPRGASAPEVDEVERHAFYDLAAQARLIVRTGELRAYGNALLRKGLAQPDEGWRQ